MSVQPPSSTPTQTQSKTNRATVITLVVIAVILAVLAAVLLQNVASRRHQAAAASQARPIRLARVPAEADSRAPSE